MTLPMQYYYPSAIRQAPVMSPLIKSLMTLPDRLRTFDGYWDEHEAAARQLAALGHVYDGYAALDEGSYCVSCNAFTRRCDSIVALEGELSKISTPFDKSSRSFTSSAHYPNCIRWQTRIPLDTRTHHSTTDSLYGESRILDMKRVFEPETPKTATTPQHSSLFVLPTELRLEIYSMIMPVMDAVTDIVPLNRDSSRVVTKMGFTKTSRRDTSKCNILRTNRAVYEDAHDILFANTTYKFDSTRVLYLFLRNIGSHGRQLIKSIDVVCGHREDAVAFSLLAACPKLKSITLRIPKTQLLPPHMGRPIWIVDGLASLLALSGLTTVAFGECKDRVFLNGDTHDANVLRRELTRPRDTASGIRWIDGVPDI